MPFNQASEQRPRDHEKKPTELVIHVRIGGLVKVKMLLVNTPGDL